ncbi:MAG TPA: acyl carrier protein [Pyrinomonadaceae bacterium]|nr:acyl carrier protein [Pyrinomonadaceae bacterium]
MSLPQAAITFLNQNAATNSAAPPKAGDDLFQVGALDSFALVDFVNVLEEYCGIKVPDADVNVDTFRTIEAVERYVAARNETC